jgi:hypothetical protein
MFRNPKTTNERRNSQDEELVRPKRNASNLPNSYDDLHNASYRDRSWKKNKKYQYRTKDM